MYEEEYNDTTLFIITYIIEKNIPCFNIYLQYQLQITDYRM